MAIDVPHRHAMRVFAESLGKPSLWVIISAPWYQDHVGAVLTASDVQVRRPITAAAIGKWRRFGTALEPLRDALDRS